MSNIVIKILDIFMMLELNLFSYISCYLISDFILDFVSRMKFLELCV